MAGCYSSSASAPLHALANQFLGESTFSAKSSLFRPAAHSSPSSSARHHNHPGQGQGYHQGGLFPRQQQQHHQPPPQQQQHQHYTKHQLAKQKTIDDDNTFEHAWSTSSSALQHQHHYQSDPWATQFNNSHLRPIPNQRHLHDLDLISSWDYATTATIQPISANTPILSQEQELAPEEFDAFYHQPSDVLTTDSLWAQEMIQVEPVATTASTNLLQGTNTQTKIDSDDDDDEDEFREEWNNDHFTQAYINTHQSQFQQIEEQDRIKEARLAEERERQRATSGGPPRSSYSWMMTGVPSPSTAMDAAIAGVTSNTAGPRRLRVPGLDPENNHFQQGSSNIGFSISEFVTFNHGNSTTATIGSTPMAVAKPIRAEDRFLSLVNDLHIAEQTYYPPASSTTLPADQNMDLDRPAYQPVTAVTTNNAWANEFATTTSAQQQHQTLKRFLGAEWNWEKLFGKDPRKPLDSSSSILATVAAVSAAATIDENERLKAVALARLQAVFKHLSLAPSSTASLP
ncbi:MAG: hypothetical protein J3R72DRAFT_459382 [Linnemannia gamsii]|nr:MAG: hypothetical protein J3R72DRAFT_459382 [Linnemannia gamsii]